MLALVHVAAWLLLSAGARRRVARLEAEHGRAVLAAASDPGRQPATGPEVAAWMRNRERWEARRSWLQQGRLVAWLGSGLLVSFLIQAGIVALVVLRTRRPRRGGAVRAR